LKIISPYLTRRSIFLALIPVGGLILLAVFGYPFLRRDRTFDGVWQTEGYGMVIAIDGGQARVLEVTGVSCLEANRVDVVAAQVAPLQVHLTRDNGRLRLNRATGETFIADPISELPKPCLQTARDPRDPEYNFEVFWHTFDEQYAFFDIYGVDWQAQYEQYRPQVTAQTSQEELFAILSAMLAPLDDSHVSLVWDDAHEFAAGTQVLTLPNFNEAVDYMRKNITQKADTVALANRKFFYRRLDDRTGYIFLAGMQSFTEDGKDEIAAAEAAIDQALEELGGVDTIIIDNRFDFGGYDGTARAIADRFTTSRRPVYTKMARLGGEYTPEQLFFVQPGGKRQFTGKVILLNSRLTVSAGEIFALAMDVLPNVTLVGETTDGHFSDVLMRKLPNGWNIGLSNEIYRTAAGEMLEGRGLIPDVNIPLDLRALSQGEDAILQSARELSTQP